MATDAVHADAIQAIEKLVQEREDAKGKIIEHGGEAYSTAKLTRIEKRDPLPGALMLSTLQGLIDYVRDKPDDAVVKGEADGRSKRFLFIEDPETVHFMSGAGGPENKRAVLATAQAIAPDLRFGQPMSVEGFIMLLRTHFTPTQMVTSLIDWFSHIDASNTVAATDDGMAQKIVIARTLNGKAQVTIPNPCPLAPLRTFSEVIQPETPFLVRLHGGNEVGKLPTVTLNEADLGQWRLAAIANIKAKLVDSLPGVAVYG